MRGYQNYKLDEHTLKDRYHRDHYNSKKTIGFFNAQETPIFGRFAPKHDVVIKKPVESPENACQKRTQFYSTSPEAITFGPLKIKHGHEGLGSENTPF